MKEKYVCIRYFKGFYEVRFLTWSLKVLGFFSKGEGRGGEKVELTVSGSLYPRASVEVESLISAVELLDDRCEVYNS